MLFLSLFEFSYCITCSRFVRGSQAFVDAAGDNDMPVVIMTPLSNALRCCSIWGSMYKFGACIIPSGFSHRDLDASMRRRTRGAPYWTGFIRFFLLDSWGPGAGVVCKASGGSAFNFLKIVCLSVFFLCF